MLKKLIDNNKIYYSVLIIIICVSFVQFPKVQFSTPDDRWMLLFNWELRYPISIDYFYRIFGHAYYGQYSPINTLYYKIIYDMFGLKPILYHFSSIIIHVFNAVLVKIMFNQIFKDLDIQDSKTHSKIIAIIFAIHPLNVESIIWISSSKVLLFTFFFLLSFIAYQNYLNKRKNIFLVFSTLFYLFGCMSKEQSCVTFIIFITYYFIRLPKLKHTSISLIVYSIIIITISLTFIIVTQNLNSNNSVAIKPILGYSIIERIVLVFFCFNFYIKNIFLPFGLHYFYAYFFEPGEKISYILFIYPILIIICIKYYLNYLFAKLKSNLKIHMFFILSFISQIFLGLQIIPLGRGSLVADRYMYLPIMYIISSIVLVTYKYSKSKFYFLVFMLIITYYVTYNQYLVFKWSKMNLEINFVPA